MILKEINLESQFKRIISFVIPISFHLSSNAQTIQVNSFDTLFINANLGRIINKQEKEEFGLLPSFTNKNFLSAAFVRPKEDSTYSVYYLLVRYKNSRDSLKISSIEEFNKIATGLDQNISKGTKKKYLLSKRVDSLMALNKEFYRHSFYVSLGTFPFISSQNVYYECTFKKSVKKSTRWFYRAGCSFSQETNFFSDMTCNFGGLIQGGVLTGSGKRHFEGAFGIDVGYTASGSQNNLFIFPAISLGVRRQRPGRHFMYRYGVGFPDAIYLGLGCSLN